MGDFANMAGAIAVILSGIVRFIRSDVAWKAVDEGYAGAPQLRELTGIQARGDLQDVFGPPNMQGIFKADRRQIVEARLLTGLLMSDVRLNLSSVAAAVLALFSPAHGVWGLLTSIVLPAAIVYQLAGWIAAARLGRAGH